MLSIIGITIHFLPYELILATMAGGASKVGSFFYISSTVQSLFPSSPQSSETESKPIVL
jgi:hypothetical protein